MVERFSISLDADLMAGFDRYISRHRYENRSEAVRDLIRKALVNEEWHDNKEVIMGVITLVYDHHQRNLLNRITQIQHDSPASIISSTHVHMDHHNCLEIIIVKGKANEVQALSDQLIALRGVKNGALNAASTGKKLS